MEPKEAEGTQEQTPIILEDVIRAVKRSSRNDHDYRPGRDVKEDEDPYP